MHFDLIQSLSLAGKASVPNDDRAGSHGALAWVIDGATDLGPPGLVGPRGGAAWIAEQANRAFSAAAPDGIVATYREVFDRVARAYDAARRREPIGRWELPIAAVLAARLDGQGLEWGALGDCVGLVARDGDVVRFGRPLAKQDEGQHAASVADADPAAVRDSLRARRATRRSAVLGVEPGDVDRLLTGRLPCRPGDDVLLMTDGFAALIDVYDALDAARLVATVRADGLAAAATMLRAIEAADTARDRFPRFKGSDDATALWLRVAGG
ncbi:protein phosphatase 2C domain-containing protein [Sphingomonas sp.]|uniref:protein phosphatase 2C domain-containing protein n=1 Tax=Sphingomonas sp. TaxID=28214 RepID=UPI002B7A65A6|nr:protein phosphatase 2C domain-containing protein [Sphingomonas sp.]HWK36133.1 protein phosphatase 2C domain-containing protein [Sphingomonas sp.]